MLRELSFSAINDSIDILENLADSIEKKLDGPYDEKDQLRYVQALAGLITDEVRELREFVENKSRERESLTREASAPAGPKHLAPINGGAT